MQGGSVINVVTRPYLEIHEPIKVIAGVDRRQAYSASTGPAVISSAQPHPQLAPDAATEGDPTKTGPPGTETVRAKTSGSVKTRKMR